MIATNKTIFLDQQDSTKQFLFDLIKVFNEIIMVTLQTIFQRETDLKMRSLLTAEEARLGIDLGCGPPS